METRGLVSRDPGDPGPSLGPTGDMKQVTSPFVREAFTFLLFLPPPPCLNPCQYSIKHYSKCNLPRRRIKDICLVGSYGWPFACLPMYILFSTYACNGRSEKSRSFLSPGAALQESSLCTYQLDPYYANLHCARGEELLTLSLTFAPEEAQVTSLMLLWVDLSWP